MKITVLGPAYPYRGGIAAFNDRLAIEFMAEGHDVSVENFSLQYPEFLFPGKTQYNPSAAPSDVKMVRSVNSVNPFNWLSVGRRIRNSAPDVLIVRYWMPFMAPCLGTIMREVKKNGKTEIVALVDNIIPHERHFYDSMLSRYFVKAADRFVVMSASVREELNQFTDKPCELQPHPLYDIYGSKVTRAVACKALKLDPAFKYIMFFGFIRDYKGLDLLLEAYSKGGFHSKGIKLIVAGEFYGNRNKYMELASGLGIKDKVLWHSDFIPDDEVRYWFSAADVIVQPYKTATQSGITQIGYHFEVPMIVTNVGGLAEIVPDGKAGYVVEPNAEDICSAIADYYENRTPDEFIEGIKEQKNKYSWHSMTQVLKGVKN